MRKMDNIGLILCDMQAKTFELSQERLSCGSEVFIRRFMHSHAAGILDSDYSMDVVMTPEEILRQVDEQYGPTSYGSVKYSANELFWIGYLYRYFSYTYEMSSSQVYKLVKPKELRKMYPACHTMDCAQAIERILEAKEIVVENNIEKQYRVFRSIRKGA